LNWGEAQVAFQQGTVDGQENPVYLIVPYKFWLTHKYVTLWHYAVDPIVLAVSAKTWAGLTPEDRAIVRKAGEEIMAEQKKEAREGLGDTMVVVNTLKSIYGMEVVDLSSADVKAFRERVAPVYTKWSEEIGVDLVRSAERLVERAR
jgi:TRAP-type transport system periplasmic protein